MDGPASIRRMFLLAALVACCSLVGCEQDVATIFPVEVKSPDGLWTARARTEQHGGPGAAGVQTIVVLRKGGDPGSPVQILLFSHDQSSRNPGIDLSMRWLTPTHLEVAYGNHPRVDFQVIKYAGIDISTRELSK